MSAIHHLNGIIESLKVVERLRIFRSNLMTTSVQPELLIFFIIIVDTDQRKMKPPVQTNALDQVNDLLVNGGVQHIKMTRSSPT